MKNSSLFKNNNIHTPTTSHSAPYATPAPNTLPPLYNAEIRSGGKRAPSELVFLVLPLALFCIAAIHICKRHFRRSNLNEAEMANQTGGDGRLSRDGLRALGVVANFSSPPSVSSPLGTLENLNNLPTTSPQNSHLTSFRVIAR